MHTFTAPILPSSSLDVFGSTSLFGLAPLKRFPGENALISQFFSPSSLREFPRPGAVGVRVRMTRPILGASRHDEEGEDKGWFRSGGRGRGSGQFRGGENHGGRGAGRGRGAPPREDTRGYSKTGAQGERRLRHPRERQWPPANPRRVYPSNLRYAPNPVYPRKTPFYPENTDSLNTGGDGDQITIKVREQDDVRRQDTLPSSSSEDPGKETYLRQLLKARSLNPKPSKSHIREAPEDGSKDEEGVARPPYARRRSPSPEVDANTNISDDENALRRALKLRRQQTREVLREHFMEAELSKTYSQLVVDSMPAFVDHILIQAVALKSQERYVTSTFVARARACLAETQVAALVKWMKHNHITYPRIGKLVDLRGRDLDRVRERIDFLKKNYVRGRDLGVVLTRHPVILDRPLKELRNLLQLLEDAGVRRDWVGFVICRSPGVLALSIDELLDKISFFQGLGVIPEHLGPMAFNFPASVGRFPLSEMQAKVEFMRRLGLVNASIGKAIALRPQLLACDIVNGWQRLVKYFKFLGIQDAGIQRIFCVHPSVFCMNLEKNIAPKVRFFRAIGIHEGAIGQVIVDFPALLSYSMDRKIRPVVRFLLEEAGVKEEHIGKVIALRPQLIGTGLTLRLKPLVQYLRNQQLRREEIGHMVADFPMLLRYNLVVIESKFRYFKRHMKRPIDDLICFPRFFSYSLEGRIKPRQQILKSNGVVLHLRSMLACNDEIFDQRVKAALERRDRGLSLDEAVELDIDDEELIQDGALVTDWVAKDTNIWGALRGDSSEDADSVDFDASTTWVEEEDRLEYEEDDAAHEVSDDEELSGTLRMQSDSHSHKTPNTKLASETEDDEWASEGGDDTDGAHVEDDANETFGEEEDDNVVGEDIDFLMKYCV